MGMALTGALVLRLLFGPEGEEARAARLAELCRGHHANATVAAIRGATRDRRGFYGRRR
jgi:hypothetical protein